MDNRLERIAELLPCTRYGHYLATCCIFHQDHTPSLLIYPDHYYCKSCDAHGTTSYLLRKLEHGDFKADNYPIFHPALWRNLSELGDVESVCLDAYYYLKHHPDLGYYLTKRGIPADFCQKLLIGFVDGYYTFPIRDAHQNITGVIARAGPVLEGAKGIRYIIPPGQSLDMLYSPDWKQVQTWAFIPFGIIDAITLSLAGFPAITGTAGHNLSRQAFKFLRVQLIFIPDGDHKDDPLAVHLASDDWRGKVMRLTYPEGAKDCNDILQKIGLEEFKNFINHAMEELWTKNPYQKLSLGSYSTIRS